MQSPPAKGHHQRWLRRKQWATWHKAPLWSYSGVLQCRRLTKLRCDPVPTALQIPSWTCQPNSTNKTRKCRQQGAADETTDPTSKQTKRSYKQRSKHKILKKAEIVFLVQKQFVCSHIKKGDREVQWAEIRGTAEDFDAFINIDKGCWQEE